MTFVSNILISMVLMLPLKTVVAIAAEFLVMPYYAAKIILDTPRKKTYTKIKYAADKRQYLCVYEPEKNVRRCKQVILLYHGGSWRMGSPEFYRLFAQKANEAGYTVAVATYRFVPKYQYYDIQIDAELALKATRNYMQQQGRGSQKIMLIGESAGGNMAAHLVYDTVRQGQPTIFSGLISIAGAINVQDMGDSQGLRNYCGVRSSQMFADANILDKLQDKETLPFFCMHGNKDVLVDYSSSVNFVEMLKLRQNENVSLVSLPDYGHMKTCFTWYTNPILFNKILEWIFEQEKLQISQMSN